MCGICGTLSLERKTVEVKYAKPMADTISHRGPDDAGYLFFHTGCRHDRNVTFFQNVTDQKFKHISQLLPAIENAQVQHELNSHDWDLFLGHRRLSIIGDVRAMRGRQ